jgi:hypothetical protein
MQLKYNLNIFLNVNVETRLSWKLNFLKTSFWHTLSWLDPHAFFGNAWLTYSIFSIYCV